MTENSSNMESVKSVLHEMGYVLIDKGTNYRSRPIYRDSDSADVLSIEKNTGRWYDFKERVGGSLEDLVKITLKLSNSNEVKDWLSKKSITINSTEEVKPVIEEPKTYPKEYLTKLLPEHEYWTNRGVSLETLNTFRGGYVKTGKMAARYVFPIFDSKEEIVGFAGRDTINNLEDRPKWKLLGRKTNWCYPLLINKNIIKEEKHVYLVESIGDMLSLWDAGVKNVIVTFGLDLSSKVINYLLKIDIDKIVISFNNDSDKNDAGNEAAKEAYKKLINYFDSKQITVKLPSKKDFGEMTKQEIIQWKNKT